MGHTVIGIDHGNGNIKTKHVVFPCGFKMQETRPSELFAKDVVSYNGAYYSLTPQRLPYQTDKTLSDNCFIFTLFGIAKELVHRAARGREDFNFTRDFSGYIGKDIALSVGLPPAHFEKQKDAFCRYFTERSRYGVDFEYNGKRFNFHIKDVLVLPQDYAAAVIYKAEVIGRYSTVYTVDIGDGTVDMVGLSHGMPDKETILSREIGMSHLRGKIIDDVINDYGVTLTDSTVEDFLAGRPLALDPALAESISSRIHATAKEFTINLINQLHGKVADFRVYPVIFCGGGAAALKPFIKGSGQFGITEFIDDIHANAVGYETMAEKAVGML